MEKTKAPKVTPSPKKTKSKVGGNPTREFLTVVLDMSWKLAIVVLVPIIGGNVLAHRYSSNYYLLGGIIVALIMAIAVVYQSYVMANGIDNGKGSK